LASQETLPSAISELTDRSKPTCGPLSLRCYVHATNRVDDAKLCDALLLIDLPKAKRQSMPGVIRVERGLHV